MTSLEELQQNLSAISPEMLDALSGDFQEADRLADLSTAVADLDSQVASLPVALASLAVHLQGEPGGDAESASPPPGPQPPSAGQSSPPGTAPSSHSSSPALLAGDLLSLLSRLTAAAPASPAGPKETESSSRSASSGEPGGQGGLDRLARSLADATAADAPAIVASQILPPIEQAPTAAAPVPLALPAADEERPLPLPVSADEGRPRSVLPADTDDARPSPPAGAAEGASAEKSQAVVQRPSAGSDEWDRSAPFGRVLSSLEDLSVLTAPPKQSAEDVPLSLPVPHPDGAESGTAGQGGDPANPPPIREVAADGSTLVPQPVAREERAGQDGVAASAPAVGAAFLDDVARLLESRHTEDQPSAPLDAFTRERGEADGQRSEDATSNASTVGKVTAELPASAAHAGDLLPTADPWSGLAALARAAEVKRPAEASGATTAPPWRSPSLWGELLPLLGQGDSGDSSPSVLASETSRVPEAEPGLSLPWLAGDASGQQLGHSGQLDLLETPHVGSIDVLNRIAEGIDALLEAVREEKGDKGGRRGGEDYRESLIPSTPIIDLFGSPEGRDDPEDSLLADFIKRLRS